MKSKIQPPGAGDRCVECNTKLANAAGIGPYCPNKKCHRVDDQWVAGKPRAAARPKKGREFWINLYPDNIACAHVDRKSAIAYSGGQGETIHVREVIPKSASPRSASSASRPKSKPSPGKRKLK